MKVSQKLKNLINKDTSDSYIQLKQEIERLLNDNSGTLNSCLSELQDEPFFEKLIFIIEKGFIEMVKSSNPKVAYELVSSSIQIEHLSNSIELHINNKEVIRKIKNALLDAGMVRSGQDVIVCPNLIPYGNISSSSVTPTHGFANDLLVDILLNNECDKGLNVFKHKILSGFNKKVTNKMANGRYLTNVFLVYAVSTELENNDTILVGSVNDFIEFSSKISSALEEHLSSSKMLSSRVEYPSHLAESFRRSLSLEAKLAILSRVTQYNKMNNNESYQLEVERVSANRVIIRILDEWGVYRASIPISCPPWLGKERLISMLESINGNQKVRFKESLSCL